MAQQLTYIQNIHNQRY